MSGTNTIALQRGSSYDDCLLGSCLKKMFKGYVKSGAGTGYIISSEVAEVRKELEQLNGGSPLELSFAYLSAMESTMPHAGFRYVIVHENNRPLVFGYFQVFTLTSKNFRLKTDKKFVKGIINLFLDLKKAKVLMAGNALRNETPCYCYDRSVINDELATEMIASAAEKIAADEHMTAVLLKDIPFTDHANIWLLKQDYHAPMTDQQMVLTIDPAWHTLADYVSALTRKYKARANKVLALREGLRIEQLDEAGVAHYAHQLNRLYKNVADSQSFALTTVSERHFAKMKEVYGPGFEVLGFFPEKKLVGFYTAIVTDNVYEIYYAGFDYGLNDQYQIYFNILFTGVERAVQLQKQQLKLGRTAFDSKASLGARPVEMNYLIKTANIPAAAVTWFVNYFSSMEDAKWKLRDPLKQPAATPAQDKAGSPS